MKPPTCRHLSTTVPATTVDADAADATDIASDANFLPSGLKLYSKLFKKGNKNNMADKDTIDTTPAPDAPDAVTPGTVAQDSGSTDFNSPY